MKTWSHVLSKWGCLVHPNYVLPHVGPLVEPLLAAAALEGLLVRVAPYVILEVASHREELVTATDKTLEHARFAVGNLVVDRVSDEPMLWVVFEGVSIEVQKLAGHDVWILIVDYHAQMLLLLGMGI